MYGLALQYGRAGGRRYWTGPAQRTGLPHLDPYCSNRASNPYSVTPRGLRERTCRMTCRWPKTAKAPLEAARRKRVMFSGFRWLRELDLNQRPSGYEPDELPDCSTPRYRMCHLDGIQRRKSRRAVCTGSGFFEIVNGFVPSPSAIMPGDDLLFQCLGTSTIGAVRFHVRVRDGIGWVTDAIATKQ